MIKFDISKFKVKNVYLKLITKSSGGTMRILDTANSTDDEEAFINLPVPAHVVDSYKQTYMTKYIKPILTSVCYYDGIVVALHPHPNGNLGQEKVETLFGTRYWQSAIAINIEKTLISATAADQWYIDGCVIYRFDNEKSPTNLTKDGKFQALEVVSYRLTDLAFRTMDTSQRMCIAYVANTGQNIISPPVWRTLTTIGKRKMDASSDDDAVILGMEEHTFDKIDRVMAPNLNFALHASKVLIENFGYDAIEPLRLDDLMVSLMTVNLPKIDQSIKNTHEIGLKFTHAMAWLIGLGARKMTLESSTALRSMLRYLTTRGIVHKHALAKDSVFHKGKDMASVELMTVENIKEVAKQKERDLLDIAPLETAWLSRNAA